MDLFRNDIIGPELISEIKRLHFQTRRLATAGLSGQYRSAFRGQGMEFEEVREYRPGDDIRSIDWKVTARKWHPYVKSFREERELTVMLAVDVSASTRAGTKQQLRETLIAKVGAVLTLIALRNNDNVGLITFSDRLETYHPPRKARGAVWRILREVLGGSDATARSSGTDISFACEFLYRILRRRAIVFLISDFIAPSFEKPLGALSRRHDVTAVMIQDPADYDLPRAGLVMIRDPETGTQTLFDTNSEISRRDYIARGKQQRDNLLELFRRHRVDTLPMSTAEPFLPVLQRYFDRRSIRMSRG